MPWFFRLVKDESSEAGVMPLSDRIYVEADNIIGARAQFAGEELVLSEGQDFIGERIYGPFTSRQEAEQAVAPFANATD